MYCLLWAEQQNIFSHIFDIQSLRRETVKDLGKRSGSIDLFTSRESHMSYLAELTRDSEGSYCVDAR